jgi:hypothetical protein
MKPLHVTCGGGGGGEGVCPLPIYGNGFFGIWGKIKSHSSYHLFHLIAFSLFGLLQGLL